MASELLFSNHECYFEAFWTSVVLFPSTLYTHYSEWVLEWVFIQLWLQQPWLQTLNIQPNDTLKRKHTVPLWVKIYLMHAFVLRQGLLLKSDVCVFVDMCTWLQVSLEAWTGIGSLSARFPSGCEPPLWVLGIELESFAKVGYSTLQPWNGVTCSPGKSLTGCELRRTLNFWFSYFPTAGISGTNQCTWFI